MKYDYLIVGAGFAGSVMAERLANKANKKILIIEKRDHVGGNAFDYINDDGILVHKYGPHIFHTNEKKVFDYLSRFTKWRNYEHKVLSSIKGQLYPIPINLTTVNKFYNMELTSGEAVTFLASKAQERTHIITAEDVVLNSVGRELYEAFFKNYTAKQWGVDPSELCASVTARIPTRVNKDDRYFTDVYQCMPLLGYAKMFESMLNHNNIHLMLNTSYKEVVDDFDYQKIIYTGPIDQYFDYSLGKLPYRSLQFKFDTVDAEKFQETGSINYPNENAYTRITEFKHLTGQKHSKTSIVYEFPAAEGDPYYPIPTPANTILYNKYKAMASKEKDVCFIGRLATYKYYNMDQVVAQALTAFNKIYTAHK